MRLVLDASPDDYRAFLERHRAEGYCWDYLWGTDPLAKFVADATEHLSADMRTQTDGSLAAEVETSETYVFCFRQKFTMPDWMIPLWRYYRYLHHEDAEDFDNHTPISVDQALADLEECLAGRAGIDQKAQP